MGERLMSDCIWPGCYRMALYADWCHAHTPRSQRPRQQQTATMVAEPSLFDLPSEPVYDGLDYKRAGQAVAVANSTLDTWKAKFRLALNTLACGPLPFTSEDVIGIVGLPVGDVAMNANNAVGAMMTAAAKTGVIRKTGNRVQSRRASSHGAELTEWIGVR
jgi:hypothetical protein